MHHLYRSKIIKTIFCLLLITTGKAQYKLDLNLPDHDDKSYYFGIVLGQNSSYHKLTYQPTFRDQNSKIGSIESLNKGGAQLGLLANLQLSKHFDLRFYPLYLTFSNQELKISDTTSTIVEQPDLGTITMSFPLQFRFKSDRINNFRVYTLGGLRYDLILNGGALEANTTIPLRKKDFLVETGIGFQFFFPYFILSPEVKFSYGLTNIHKPDFSDQYSRLIDRMSNRMISFSLHFEGGILGKN